MSNYMAVASVTASLAKLLRQGIGVDAGDTSPDNDAVPGAEVTTDRPDGAANGTIKPRINVYLYQVTPNAAWRNSDLPTRDADGQLTQRPRAALDLHYLLTFYGDEKKFEPQRLLGAAVRTLHSRPVLPRTLIRDAVKAFNFLAGSNLAEDIELVKFTPTTLTLEELSRLWAVFFQTQYTLSVTYQASVVLIEEDVSTRQSLPVLERNVYALPFRQPVIETVKLDAPAAPTDGPIVAESKIVIRGRALKGDRTQVSFGGSDALGIVTEVTDTEIKATLPNALRAGIQGLQVEHQLMIGTPPAPHRGFESNVAAFALAPAITPSFTRTSAAGVRPVDGDLTAAFVPNVGKTQRVKLLLNEIGAPESRRARAYSFNAPENNGIEADDQIETDEIVFKVKRILPGEYLVRVQVDGAESPVERNTDQTSPDFGKFTNPKVTVS
jgi:hypothetical protein